MYRLACNHRTFSVTLPEIWFCMQRLLSRVLLIFSGVILQEGSVSSITLGFHVLFRNEFQ